MEIPFLLAVKASHVESFLGGSSEMSNVECFEILFCSKHRQGKVRRIGRNLRLVQLGKSKDKR